MIVLLLLAQAAPAPAAASERWSVLADPCPRGGQGEIVVCAPATTLRLPLPDERPPPDRPRQPLNEPRAALENAGSPCAIRGCTVGFGPDVMALGKVVIDEIGHALKRKHPGKREPIALD